MSNKLHAIILHMQRVHIVGSIIGTPEVPRCSSSHTRKRSSQCSNAHTEYGSNYPRYSETNSLDMLNNNIYTHPPPSHTHNPTHQSEL